MTYYLPYHLMIDIYQYFHQMNLDCVHDQYHNHWHDYGGMRNKYNNCTVQSRPLSNDTYWWRNSDMDFTAIFSGPNYMATLPYKYLYTSGKNSPKGYLEDPIYSSDVEYSDDELN